MTTTTGQAVGRVRREDDPASFVAQYPALREAAIRAAYWVVRNREDAEDVASETMLAAYTRWDRLRHYRSILAWVRRAARYRAIDRLRRRSRLVYVATVAPSLARVEEPEDVLHPIVDAAVTFAFSDLTRRQQQLVWLVRVLGIKHHATSRCLGIDRAASRKLTDYAVIQLRRHFAREVARSIGLHDSLRYLRPQAMTRLAREADPKPGHPPIRHSHQPLVTLRETG